MGQTEAKRRRKAARELDRILDSKVFDALCEPARIEILKLLTVRGRSDIATIAAHVPQDRSVVSRHLARLSDAGIVRREKVGRNVFYEMDGPATVAQLEEVLARFRALVSLCCPGKGARTTADTGGVVHEEAVGRHPLLRELGAHAFLRGA